ncbi:hypothetical protein OH77DRAFT_1499288 [Trametes cingulata]|nr:hypothetical protein OH77DRAFT_1499288 [Trametes cingulata]
MQQPGFNPADLAGFDAAREVQRLDTYIESTEGSPLSAHDGWINGSVTIWLPKEGVRYPSEADAPAFVVKGVYYRSLTEVIQNAYQQPCVKDWHVVPYKLYWLAPSAVPTACREADPSSASRAPTRSPSPTVLPSALYSDSSSSTSSSSSTTSFSEPGIRVYSEIYDSDALLADDEEIQQRAREAEDAEDVEYIVVPILLWSDSTHLANFGTASLWPAYAYFGSQSKYTRGKPTAFAAHHIAYIPSLPDIIQDTYTQIYGVPATAAMLTFLRRELMQEVWLLLLDDHFMYIYVHGYLLLCGNKIRRRLFPRFQFHSADYFEKILQACLKYFAKCPCPRCRINKDTYRRNHLRLDDDDLQYRIKLTRCWIFEEGVSLTSVYMKRILNPLSITPTRIECILCATARIWFNFYSLYVPDLMHEFELGNWKSVLTHILGILFAIGGDLIQELNRRFRQIPTFGRIRKFCDNVADQRKLAARDYENNLRTSMPVMEDLLDDVDDNKIILDMIFDLCTWHCLAKLRTHMEPLLEALSTRAVEVGRSVRKFANVTCSKWYTVDLPKEAAARGRCKAAVSKKTGKVVIGKGPEARRRRVFNLNTYKYHSIRDYPAVICLHATTDNWSTQTGELKHRHVKHFYARTNKNNHEYQIAQHMRRAEKLRIIKMRVDAARQKLIEAEKGSSQDQTEVPGAAALSMPQGSEPDKEEDIAYSNPWDRYHIAESQRDSDDITAWVSAHRSDPPYKDFIPRLRTHLSSRWDGINGIDSNLEAVPVPHSLHLVNNRIYHRVNPRTHPDIFMLSGNASAESEDVRWFALDPLEPGGFPCKRLHRLQFVKEADSDSHELEGPGAAFSFVDPRDVIRGIHLIPAFAHKHTDELLGRSEATRVGPEYSDDPDMDFRYYYVNMFADRDIFLRYHGGGIGHALQGGEYESEFFVSDDDQPEDNTDDMDVENGDEPDAEEVPDDSELLPATAGEDLLALTAGFGDEEELDERNEDSPDGDDDDIDDSDGEDGCNQDWAGGGNDEYGDEGFAPL